MLKELIQAFTKRDVLGSIVAQFGEMIDAGQWMFETASGVVEQTKAAEDVRKELYSRDRRINELERGIRERIVVHLSLGNRQDASMCLVFMSVVKDAERVGDYCKNLFEIGQFFKSRYQRGEYSEPLREMCCQIDGLFPRIRDAFIDGDHSVAQKVINECLKIRHRCDLIIEQLLSPGATGPIDEAVAFALRSRFHKRVTSHLANIATSITNPVPMIDYHRGQPLDEPGK